MPTLRPGTRREDQEELAEGLWVWLLMAGAFLAGCSQDMGGYVSGLQSYSCQRGDRIHDCRQLAPQQLAAHR